jgi:hypothetical protein
VTVIEGALVDVTGLTLDDLDRLPAALCAAITQAADGEDDLAAPFQSHI